MANILIAYYSRKGENYWNGQIIDLAVGNTEVAAKMIQKAVGGELFEIETVQQYPADYTACTQQARSELRADARPELKAMPEDLEKYDTVFLCYPNWCGTCPMPVFSFLDRCDLGGKRIAPLCTNEGSGMGRSEADIAKHSGAQLCTGLSVRGCEVLQSELTISKWALSNI